jgi:hypothetical protein
MADSEHTPIRGTIMLCRVVGGTERTEGEHVVRPEPNFPGGLRMPGRDATTSVVESWVKSQWGSVDA